MQGDYLNFTNFDYQNTINQNDISFAQELGTVKKPILKHFGIKQEVLFADFNWNLVLKLISNKIKFK